MSQGAMQLSQNGEQTDTLEQLATFTQKLAEELEESDAGNTLIDTLNKAHEIIDGWEGDNPAAMSTVAAVASSLEEFKGSPDMDALSQSDQHSLLELELAMHVAQKLNPVPEMSGKINHYLDVLKQSR